jgi:hypothetical protein
MIFYEGESVNTSQMDTKRKTCNIQTWKKHLFLDMPSTNINTLVPSLYQCVETRSIEVIWPLSQPLVQHQLRLSNVLERISRPSCEPFYATNTSHRKQETFLYEYPLRWVLLPTRAHNRTLLIFTTLLKRGHYFHYCNLPLNMSLRVCYLDYHEAGLCCYLVIHI